MVDTKGSGIEFSRGELDSLEKVCDLFTNESRCIYAELRRSPAGMVYLREWMTSRDVAYNFAIITSVDELKSELKKDVDHGDLAPGRVNAIVNAAGEHLNYL